MKKYFLGTLIVILSIIGFTASNNSKTLAYDEGTCGAVGVGFTRNQLPLNTYPSFTITGPGGITIPSSRFFPGTGGSTQQTVRTTSSGAPLPPGSYRINVEPMAGTSRLVLINSDDPPTSVIQCPSATSILFWLSYEPAAPDGGPSLRMNPAPQTVQVGNTVLFGAEYSADGESWGDVSGQATFSSPQAGTLVSDAVSPHGGNLKEITGWGAGVAQITATYAGLTTSTNLTVTAGAPPSPRAPNCQMWSNPQTATGGTVTLNYTVGYLPTTITVTASDASATPPGTPTVGAPDPVRVDSRQTGSVVTGPITEDTTFTMTVSNSRGSSHCNVEVPFVAAPEAGLQLPLVATLLDLPNEMVYAGPTFGSQNIQGAAYANGVFAFSGACGGTKDQTYLGAFRRQGGARFFKDDGTFIVERDLCMDGGSRFQTLFMHGGAHSQMVADGDRGFFMAVRSNAGSVSGNTYGSGAEHAGYYQVAGDSILFTSSSNFTVGATDSYAAANGKVVGEVDLETPGDSRRNVTLSTPSLQILAEREAHSIRPILGFGDYIIGGTSGSQSTCRTPYSPYGVPIVFRPESDGGLTSVQELTLPDGLCAGKMAIDYTSSPKRLAVTSFERQSSTSWDITEKIFFFTSGANGLEPAGETTIPSSVLADINRASYPSFPAFAVGGSYLVFAGQPNGDERYFTLWNGGTLTGVAQAPLRRDYGTGTIGEPAAQPSYLYMTPQGKIMAGGIRNAYLFGSNASPGSGTTATTTPSGGTPSPYDIFDGPSEPYETIFGTWLRALRGIPDYDTPTITPNPTPTPGPGSQPPRIFLDVVNGIQSLYSENTSTGVITKISKEFPYRANVGTFVISHDGRSIAYNVKNQDNSDAPVTLYSVPITGGTSVQISRTPDNMDVSNYKFSPNDQYLVFSSHNTVNMDGLIYSARTTGEGLRRLSYSDEDVDHRNFVVSCDSGTVYYRNRHTDPDLQKAYSVAITGGTITTLQSYTLPDVQCGS